MPDEQHTDRTATPLAVLRRALEDPAVEVRREAALALGYVSTAEAREALLGALRGDSSVWREAAVALSRHHDQGVVEGLTELLASRDADEHTRRGAALALGALLAGEPLSMETAVGPAAFEDEQGRMHVML